MNFLILSFLICAFQISASSQASFSQITNPLVTSKAYIITDTTYDCNVIMSSGEIYEDVELFALRDTTVNMLKKGVARELNIKDIRTIRFKGIGFLKGAVIGGGIVFISGVIAGVFGIGKGSDHGGVTISGGDLVIGGLLAAIPLGLIGGVIGSIFAKNHTYDLSNRSAEGKKRLIEYLINKYSDKYGRIQW